MMKIILLTLISFIFSFNTYAASPQLKPVMKKNPASTIKATPKASSQITIAKPDFFVSSFDVLPNPIKSGGACRGTLIIGNKGANSLKKTIGIHISFPFYPGGVTSPFLVAPAAGQKTIYEVEIWIPTDYKGNANFVASVDYPSPGGIAESDETNNSGSDSVMVQACPDLGFCKAKWNEVCHDQGTAGGVGKKIFVGVDIFNYGSVISSAGRTLSVNIPGQWPIVVSIPPIEPGKFWPYGIYKTWDTPGTLDAKIIINNNGKSDSKNNNNAVDYEIIVTP